MRNVIRWTAVLALVLTPLSLAAQINPVWTAVASTGVVDELNYTPVNFAFNGPSLGFLGASIAPAIVARYNVTNLAGVSNPAWATLELGSIDSSAAAGNQVMARLIQVRPCNGAQAVLCTVVSKESTAGSCNSCNFTTGVDFTQFLYYVEVTVQRTSANSLEQALTLRIF